MRGIKIFTEFGLVQIEKAIIAPIIVIIRGHSLSDEGRTGSSKKLNLNQFSIAPPKIAPKVKAIIGEVIRVEESFTY